MNGIGQETQVIMPDLQQAMLEHSAKQRQYDAASQLSQGGNGWGGLGEILGAALGSYKSNKLGGELDQSSASINQQIQAFQEQKAQEMAQMQAAKEQAEYERKRADEIAKYEREQAGKKELKQFEYDNRAPQQASQPGFSERLFNQLSPEQKQSYMNQFSGVQQQNQMFTPQEIAFMEQNPDKAPALKQKKENEFLGVKPDKALSDGANQKISFLKNAVEKLQAYKQQAFKDGDYQEIGSKFGNTDNLLKEAVRNKLRSESGAAISDQELASELDLFSPSMFRSDETNISRIDELEKTLNRLITEQGGGIDQQPSPQQQPAMQKTDQLLNKYLSN